MDPGWVSGHRPENRVWAKARATGGHSAGGPERAASVENAWNRKYSNWVLWGGDELRKHRWGGLPPTRHRTGTPPEGRGTRLPLRPRCPLSLAPSPAARDLSAFPPGVRGGGGPWATRGWAAAGTGTQRAWRRPDWPRCPRSRCPRMLYTVTAGTPSFARGVPRTQRSHKNSGVSSRRVGSPCSSGGRTALRGWGREQGARPRWALTTLSPRPRRTMLREQYVDRARVAVFGKVSRAGWPRPGAWPRRGGGPTPAGLCRSPPFSGSAALGPRPFESGAGTEPVGVRDRAPSSSQPALHKPSSHSLTARVGSASPRPVARGLLELPRAPRAVPPHTGVLGEQGRAACRPLSAECFFPRKPQGSLAKIHSALKKKKKKDYLWIICKFTAK